MDDKHVVLNGRQHNKWVKYRQVKPDGLYGYITWNIYTYIVPGSHRYKMAKLIWAKF